MALMVIAFVMFLFVAIIFNLKSGEKYRQSLVNKLDQLRLAKMLGALGIDVNAYLHQERIVDIQKQMKHCADCENTNQCDEKLSTNKIAADDIEFCNNEKALQDIIKKRSASHET
jgi:hypothetical protein